MKKIFAILAALSVAVPANAFIVVPEEEKGPKVNKTKLSLWLCFDLDSRGKMISGSWNKKCTDVGNQTEMWWTGAEKCDDFVGCAKAGMFMVNDFFDTAYYEGELYEGKIPTFVDKTTPITYYPSVTINCRKGSFGVYLKGIDWERNFKEYNPTMYRYSTTNLQREICNKAYNVDTKAIKRSFGYIAMVAACGAAHDDNWEKREKCKDDYVRKQERLQWK